MGWAAQHSTYAVKHSVSICRSWAIFLVLQHTYRYSVRPEPAEESLSQGPAKFITTVPVARCLHLGELLTGEGLISSVHPKIAALSTEKAAKQNSCRVAILLLRTIETNPSIEISRT